MVGRILDLDVMVVAFQKWRWTEIAVTLGLVFVASIRKEWPMTFIAVRCLTVRADRQTRQNGSGYPALLMPEPLCAMGSFLLDYCNREHLPEVKHMIIDMSLNASGVRDTARSLHICPNTVLRELKKKATVLESVNTALLRAMGKRRWMRCGRLAATKATHASCGMPLTMARERS